MVDSPRTPLSTPWLVSSLVLAIVAWTAIVVPLRVLGHGWLPPDDVRRHAAKVVADRSWSEILVLRDEATVDPHPGWHALLELAEAAGARSPLALAKVSIALLGTLFLLLPALLLKRPEAWLVTLAGFAVFEPLILGRLLYGRPYVLTMIALTVILAIWPRLRAERPPYGALAAIVVAVAASAWIHGNWYLWALPIAAFFLAGERRALMRFVFAVALGCALGALATGHPIAFLHQTALHPYWALGGSPPQRALVTEFRPGNGSPVVLLAVGLVLLWRARSSQWRIGELATPSFSLAAIAWLLSFQVQRFWLDWGMPALMIWLALELQGPLERFAAANGRRRLAVALAAATIFVLAYTNDRGFRWSKHPRSRLAALEEPANRGWLPQPGGVVYGNELFYFYDLFFRYPTAPWRYQVGFEPALMPPADLAIFRNIEQESASDESLRPWADRMQPADRLLVRRSGAAPGLPGLEWKALPGGIWIGRSAPAGAAATTTGPSLEPAPAPAALEDDDAGEADPG